ncbi:MAG: methyltransferase domain-containing protein [Rhizobiaceae bacterium]|nr:methyltransferase domain-containing protein [Rhizobiaceae bacterium]MCV0408042.1 methyltransferase domain-containing protein [Rhizobiaceae bacterium]
MALDPAVRERLRESGRAVWSAGHWDEVANYIDKVGTPLLDAIGIEPGMRLLDVGAGSGGNIAIPAALRGASVVASDLVANHFEDGKRRAADAGVAASIEWVEADASDLPFADETFDRVTSTFGHMFAPDQEATARELARVLKPGGKIGIACWTPEGVIGGMFKLQSSYMPPPPPGVPPPVLWGSVERVTELFEPYGLDLSFEKKMNVFEHESLEDYNANFKTNFGPMVMARKMLGDKFDEMSAKVDELFSAANEAGEGALRVQGEYLQTIATKPG